MVLAVVTVLAVLALAVLVYGWFEAGWLRTRVLEVRIDGLPPALDGLRIGHLSDFHLGAPFSRGNGASARAVAWVAARRPDLVCVTGDLVSHPRGEPRLRSPARSSRAAVRDPRESRRRRHARSVLTRSRAPRPRASPAPARRRRDRAAPRSARLGRRRRPRDVPRRGRRARTRSSILPRRCALLLCHFPGVVHRLPPGSFDLVLAGHLHAGQICLPLPGRLLTLAHPRAHIRRRPLPARRPARCTSRPGRERASSLPVLRPAGGDGARPQNASRLSAGGARGHLARRPRRLRGRCRTRGRRRRCARRRATAASRRARDGGRRQRSTIEVHVAVGWGARAPEIGADVQRRVAEYVRRTAKVSASVDVVIAGVAAPGS